MVGIALKLWEDPYLLTEYLNTIKWYPWVIIVNDMYVIQLSVLCSFLFILFYSNIYYILLYSFVNFFLMGVYLSISQIELFTALLWLIECSVLFVFLLLLFYLNVKYKSNYIFSHIYAYVFIFYIYVYFFLVNCYCESDNDNLFEVSTYSILDNYYEAFQNDILNDLFGFFVSYFFLNGVEFLLIGFLLLIGSVICVNLHQMNKNVRTQTHSNYLLIFNLFKDLTSFFFLRKQSLIKQGFTKPSTKVFKNS